MTSRDRILLVIAVLVLAGQTDPLALRNDGIQFPDGSLLTSAGGSYARVLTVAASGGHFTSIQAALDSISGASDSSPYLVWVAPGSYSGQVMMEDWVDIQGAGRDITRIFNSIGGGTGCTEAAVFGADHAELRSLTAFSFGDGMECAAAMINSGASPTLTDVKLKVHGGVFNVALLNELGSQPRLNRVEIEACGYFDETCADGIGIWNLSSAWPRLTDSLVSTVAWERALGLFNQSGSLVTLRDTTIEVVSASDNKANVRLEDDSEARIYHSVLISDGVSIDHDTSDITCRVAHSEIGGSVSSSCRCVAVHDAGFELLDAACQPPSP
ncbi:MAG: hypothetical protein GY769_17815 [bacterium]|nr:hypothetical protein [bacterium]